ncbi:sugar porter family MFS transporter [Commensalibacter oyaizuii]|uniref:Sugar porter family MFS transporter n=1 Tax=Commensalibacter oyaizuii TaxID=3043873 RepID=A0ABT6Q2T3_9PROT|nr:sugar porter family MFS transporter [Commensalibacter sp. TBRC 16381]MDI2091444.1 sugar porter family MFS transporter [Commensalibacter sp. TBRC 16381]
MTSPSTNGVHAKTSSAGSMILIAGIAALGGLLFGYNTGIIGVAALGLGQQFALDATSQQIVTSAIILGALLGCLIVAPFSDRFGRRPVIAVIGILFVLGSLASAFAPTLSTLIWARFLLGFPTGAATQVIPGYIAEIAPSHHRGKMVSLFQVMVVLGITIAYFGGYPLGSDWRLMLGLGAIPAVILLIGIFALPESPRWLLTKNRTADALKILTKLRGGRENAQKEIDHIQQISNQPQGSWKDLAQPWIRPAVIVGTSLAMFCQITGNNALIYYAPTIFTNAGFPSSFAVLGTGFSMLLVAIMTIIGSILVDKVGRRRYLLWTIPGSIVALILMGYLFMDAGPQTDFSKMLTVLCLCIYMMLNCGGFGVCIWLINAEVYPLFVRGKGGSLGAFSNWIFTLVVSLTTLSLVDSLGTTGTFWLYAVISTIALIFIIFLVPETNGRHLEEIEEDLRQHRFYAFQQK